MFRDLQDDPEAKHSKSLPSVKNKTASIITQSIRQFVKDDENCHDKLAMQIMTVSVSCVSCLRAKDSRRKAASVLTWMPWACVMDMASASLSIRLLLFWPSAAQPSPLPTNTSSSSFSSPRVSCPPYAEQRDGLDTPGDVFSAYP